MSNAAKATLASQAGLEVEVQGEVEATGAWRIGEILVKSGWL
jgi:hypothetical protein